jgi:quercetin dioxygenase-like cupin family protein
MSSVAFASNGQEEAFWWQGGLYRIKATAQTTGGALGLVEGDLPRGFGPPLHIHRREDEAVYVIEGEVRFRQGEEECVGGPGFWAWGPRALGLHLEGVSHAARVLIVVTPGGFERMFEVGGVPLSESSQPPVQEYDPAAAVAMSHQFGFEVVGPQLP